MRHALFLLALLATPAFAQIEIENAWTRATPPGAKTAAGYMTIRNQSSSPDHLIRATSPLAARVEMHVHLHDGDVMRMRQVKGYDLPAKGSLELKPGIAHLMFVDIKQPFKEGEKIPVTLRFERAGEMTVTFTVGRIDMQH
ncbi:MAG TPA: copper chaperone PCu(A)C [Burkholderiales bacterium]|nr:copper chaperone PCu(A)C [Burkholderiales bacterium]